LKHKIKDIVSGLTKIELEMDKKDSYLYPNLLTMEFTYACIKSEEIYGALDFLEKASKDQTVFAVENDIKANVYRVQFNPDHVGEVFKTLKRHQHRGLLDPDFKTREMYCSSIDESKKVIQIILALCSYNMYSGYAYDYTTQNLTIFT
jgi:hypothetical protein